MKFVFLTNDFYIKYSSCSEIEQKQNRPYCMLLTKIDETTWAIPLRSNINHNNVVWSNKSNKCGLDLSKAVVVEDSKYIDTTTHVWIRTDEFKILKSKDHIINKKMENYREGFTPLLFHLIHIIHFPVLVVIFLLAYKFFIVLLFFPS